MLRPVILIVTADPGGVLGDPWPSNAGRLALDQELDGILRGVALAPFHDFELISVRAVTVSELVQLLQKFNPTMLYFAGHGVSARRASVQSSAATRDIEPVASEHDGGIILLGDRGEPCKLTAATLALIIPTAAPALRILALNACHGAEQAEILCRVVDCVIAVHGQIRDEAARSFAFVLFCALVNRQSIGGAVALARDVMVANGYGNDLLQCDTRAGIHPDRLFVAGEPRAPPARHRMMTRCLVAASVALTVSVAAAAIWSDIERRRRESCRQVDDAHDSRVRTGSVPEIDRRPERPEPPIAPQQDRESQQQDPDHPESDRDEPAPRSDLHSRDADDHSGTPRRNETPGPGVAPRPGGARRHAPAEAPGPGAAPQRKRQPQVSSPLQAAIVRGAIEPAQLNAQGELDRDTIQQYIEYHRKQIRYCYEKKRMAVPTLAGTVSVQFFITPRGTVASLTAAGLDREVASCVANAIRDIAFPSSSAGVWVKYPYHFVPPDDR